MLTFQLSTGARPRTFELESPFSHGDRAPSAPERHENRKSADVFKRHKTSEHVGFPLNEPPVAPGSLFAESTTPSSWASRTLVTCAHAWFDVLLSVGVFILDSAAHHERSRGLQARTSEGRSTTENNDSVR